MIRDFYNDIEDDAPSADPNEREDDPIYFNSLAGSGVGAVFYTIPPSFVASGHFPLPGTGKARLTTGYQAPPSSRWPNFPRLSCVDLGFEKVCTIYYEGMNVLMSKRLKNLLNAYEDDPSITHRVGIISMDFPGLTLIKRIVALNGVPPNNAPPVAILTPLVYQGNEGSYITFSAAFSIDPNGDDLEFRWDFDGDLDWDTEWSESPTISHAYPDDWVGSMVVEVRDSWDASSTATGYVTVHNAPPVLDVRSNANADEGAMVTLGLTEFTDQGILDTHAATVDWGDGTGLQNGVVAGSGSSKTISGSHVYADNGIYVVDVCVTDDDGGSACDSFQVTVVNVPPTVSAGPDVQINESDSVSLPPSVFNDLGTLDTHTAVIHWGDGTPSESGAVAESPFGPPGSTSGASGSVSGTHQYGDDGVYTVSVDVTDDDGGIGAGSFRVTVLNVDPTVSLDTSTETGFCGGGAFTGRIGVEQSHDASADDIGSDDLQFVWTAIDEVFHADFEIGNRTYFNNGISPDPYPSPQGVLPYHADNEVVVIFSMPGVYTILVTVIDDDGGTVEDSLPKLVAGDDPCTRRLGLWAQQFSLHGEHQMTDDTLIAYLAYIDFASAFFSEVVSATTIEEARAFLAPRNSSTNRGNKGEKGANGSAANMKDKAAQELLAAWLNVASGSVGLQEMLSNRMTILQTLCHVELVLMDPTSEHHDYLDARAYLRLITNIGCRF